MFQEVTGRYDAKSLSKEIERLWEQVDAYRKVRELRRGGKKFFFVDGPPYTTGQIHLGTAWNKVIKDSILRFKSMSGFDILERAGWDMHGLPIEIKVEELLGFKSKKDIEAYGVENFIKKCKEYALAQKESMTGQFQQLGVWLNWEEPYMTLKDDYIEAAWWTLKQAWERGLLEEGRRVVNWCPRCETAIADAEVEYWDREDPSIYVKFKVKGKTNTYIVIWTTTPWTLPANLAVAVHPSFEYAWVKAKKDGSEETLIMARELTEHVLREGRYQDYEILDTMLGEELASLVYEHPLADLVPFQQGFEHKVFLAEFVTAENTGCVHIAPGHGLDDFELGLKHGLPPFCPVGPDGTYTREAGAYSGMSVWDANRQVLQDLRERGALLASGTILHRYGHCWRCKTPIIYLATDQWFISITRLRDEMLREIEQVKWYPSWAGSARFRDWVAGARDWCISRQRYWGIPLPLWRCEKCKNVQVIGSLEELKKLTGSEPPELHRPYVDQITLKCACGGEMRRVQDVFDVWFDSAVASWAALGYPAREEEFRKWWPADFITEGHDQTRGWFYSQLGASIIAFGQAPYKSVLMHGFTLDEEGHKMSKSKGNTVTPSEVIRRYGAEALRLYLLSQNAPWEDLKFSWEGVANSHRTLNILWNVYKFPLPYMALDNFNPQQHKLEDLPLRVEDRWILSRTSSTLQKVTESMESYELHRAVRSLTEFILEDLSRWYIQLIRPRTWTEAEDPDKIAAYKTIHHVLTLTAKMLAPFTPYTSEAIYQNLTPKPLESVHMTDWPTPEKWLNPELEEKMETARQVVEAASSARQQARRKLRWPLKRIIITPQNKETYQAISDMKRVIQEQSNTQNLTLLEPGEVWEEISEKALPNYTALGPVFRKEAGKIAKAIQETPPSTLKKALQSKGSYEVLPGKKITQEMVNWQTQIPENIYPAEFPGGTLYIDTTLTPQIESQGYAREIVRRIQDMRKQLDLAVEDKINVKLQIPDTKITDLIKREHKYIIGEVRAAQLEIDQAEEGKLVKEWDVEGVKIKIAVTPI